LVLLAAAQVFLGFRFRRVVNPLLLAATLLVAAAPVLGAGLALESRGRLDGAAATLDQVVGARQREAGRQAAAGRQALAALVARECGGNTSGCGTTVARFSASVPSTRVDPAGEKSTDAITEAKTVNTKTESARVSPNAPFVVVVVAVAVVLLIQWGFRARLDEYRFQPR
jgi:cobalamin biosynthesis Mg chelatase CobN